ncbi:MAG TPA: hypothetical protein VH280_14475 [Verrucomicrobiae bacterium]|nr:hypothetical protein [Verrucomicrobiae bacterium]
MNRQTDEKINGRPLNEADKFLEQLYAYGIVSPIINRCECKMKIVKLGLTVPDPNQDCILFATEGKEAAYVFSCICDRDPESHQPRREFMGFVFEIPMYRRNPIRGIPDAGQAVELFVHAVARLEGIDLNQRSFVVERPDRN